MFSFQFQNCIKLQFNLIKFERTFTIDYKLNHKLYI